MVQHLFKNAWLIDKDKSHLGQSSMQKKIQIPSSSKFQTYLRVICFLLCGDYEILYGAN